MNRASGVSGAAIVATEVEKGRPPWQITCLYLTTLGAAACSLWFVLRTGDKLMPVSAAAMASAHKVGNDLSSMVHILIALVTIVSGAQLLGRLCVRLGQPPVIGEIVAGLVLGPSVLGSLAPNAMHWLLPANVGPVLSALSQVGVILYMFLIGLELDTAALRQRSHVSLAISHASIAVPFLFGSVLALAIFSKFAPSGISFTPFALFCGVAMSITAFPVLARILRDKGMLGSPIGTAAIGCAVVDDVTAWCLLAFVVGCVKATSRSIGVTIGLALAYVAMMLFVVRPCLRRVMSRRPADNLPPTLLAVVLISVLLSSLATEFIGLHAIFGSFLLGVVLPKDSLLASSIRGRIEDLIVVLLLPIFFAYTGTRVQIGLLSSAAEWLTCGLVVLTACIGKFGGTALTARFTGFGWRDAAILGTLMNTRGLVELIVLNVGQDLGILSPTLFTMFVMMAVVTTVMTSPLLNLINRRNRSSRDALTVMVGT